jgi:hypothetical protein
MIREGLVLLMQQHPVSAEQLSLSLVRAWLVCFGLGVWWCWMRRLGAWPWQGLG